jgi:hypothetical protein
MDESKGSKDPLHGVTMGTRKGGAALPSSLRPVMNNLKTACLVVALLLAVCCQSDTAMSEEEERTVKESVQRAFDGLVEASRSLNAERYFEYFDDQKFSGLSAAGTVWHSIEDLESVIRPGFSMIEEIQSLEFDNVKITIVDRTTAILVNEYNDTALLKNGEVVSGSGGGVQVWSKSGGSWKLVSVADASKTRAE